jgi:hypothetical protein
VKPFSFGASPGQNKEELQRFTTEAARWKPGTYNADAERRLTYFLYRQRDLLLVELKKRYPETCREMAPVTLPVCRFFVKELSKVFLGGANLPLVDADGKPLPTDGEDAKAWVKLQEDVGLALKLKRLDRYTTLFHTAFLRWAYSAAGVSTQIVFPHLVEAVMDQDFPMDLDRAHLVRVELTGAAGETADDDRRFECFCAREGEELHAIVRGDGTVEWAAAQYDYRDEDGRALVPLIAFTQHTEELGLFALVEQGLHEFNLAIDVAITGLFEIAETQGWGELFITVPDGGKPPAKIIRGPRRAMPLTDGNTASILNYNAPISELAAKLDQDLKRQAVLNGIPPGAVSLEARAVSSGIALQIEMRPLLEERQDSVEVYAQPMRRVWQVARAVWAAYAATGAKDAKPFGKGVHARWEPGEIQMPESEDVLVERMLIEARAGYRSDEEAVARIRGVSEEEAAKLLEKIRKAKAARDPLAPDIQVGLAGDKSSERVAVDVAGGGAPGSPAAPSAPAVPGGAEVVQDTALNGAQVTSLLEIVQLTADRGLPFEAAQELIAAAFPGIAPERITRIMAALKKFKPAGPAADPSPPDPPEPSPMPPAPQG